MHAETCDNFEPQRFRPTFCKTCCKSKLEHSKQIQEVAKAALPPPLSVSQSPAPLKSVTIPPSIHDGKLRPLTRSSIACVPPTLRKPAESKKGQIGRTVSAKLPQLSKRQSVGLNTNNIRQDLRIGFVAKQQRKGELPNANKYFMSILQGLLTEGIGLPSNEAQDLIRRVKASSTVQQESKEAQLLINKKKKAYLGRFMMESSEFMAEQIKLRKVITVQSQVRTYLVTKRFRKMSPEKMERMKKRNATYKELVKTERNFISYLDITLDVISGLRNSDVLAPHERAFIFSNTEVVAEEHRNLLHRLLAAADDWPFLRNIGAIFLDIKKLLNALSVYVSNFKNAMNEFERLFATNPQFSAYVEEKSLDSDLDLTIALAMPVNRISQYEYVLDVIAQHEEEGTESHRDCINAFAVLAQSSLVVQTSLVESGETARILALKRKLTADGPMALVKPGRRLLNEAEHKFKKTFVVLFNDYVVLARHPQGKSIASKKDKKEIGNAKKHVVECYKVKSVAPLKDCSLNKLEKFLEFTVAGEVYKLHPTSDEQKMRFVIAFNQAVEEQNRAKVFGVPLEDTVKREKPEDGIPFVLRSTILFLENYLDQPGIFRLAGSKQETVEMKEQYDQGGEEAERIVLKDKNIHSVCDIVKSYLRSFPEPILSYAVYDPLVTLMKNNENDKESKIQKIREQIQTHASPVGINVLRHLMKYVYRVSQHSDVNKMTTSNLSIVFGPTCLWPKENSLESAMDMPYINSVLQLIIENCDEILPVG